MLAWLLLLVFLNPVDGFSKQYVLNSFDTQSGCQSERDRIGFDMAEAYPGELDFRIECHENARLLKHISSESEGISKEVMGAWAKLRYPKQQIKMKITSIKTILTETGDSGIIAAQIILKATSETRSYILFIKKGGIIGWIDAGAIENEEEEGSEVFSHKDAA
jgi:hypothetical protein